MARGVFEPKSKGCGPSSVSIGQIGSRLAMMGVPLEAIGKLMGHGSITVKTRYAHLAPSFEEGTVNRLGSFAIETGMEIALPKSRILVT